LHVRGYTITPVRVDHVVPAYGYVVEDGAHNALVYTGDSGPTDRIWKAMRHRRVRVLITEVSFPNELQHLALASGHMTPALFAREVEKMPIIPERIFITHVKPFYRHAIETQMAKLSGVVVEFLRDNMEIKMPTVDGAMASAEAHQIAAECAWESPRANVLQRARETA
jgi:ribonuclease BN (tRNA processing enzyme)